ncbi:MAG: hypothetical protein ACK47B_23785 [Armatimonadota bacterium]
MALTIAIRKRTSRGNRKSVIADITFDNSYPTGGESLTAADLGMNTLDHVTPGAATGYVAHYDHANSKLIASAGNAQVANTTDLSAVTVRVEATGH